MSHSALHYTAMHTQAGHTAKASAKESTTETSHKVKFFPGPSFSRFFFRNLVISGPFSTRSIISAVFFQKNSHSKTIYHQIQCTSSIPCKINHFGTIPYKTTSSHDWSSQNQLFQNHLPPKVSSQHQSSKIQPFQDHFTTDNVCNIIALKQAFPQLFDQVCNLPGTYTIHTDPSIPPVQHIHHKFPIECKEPIGKSTSGDGRFRIYHFSD